jgi:glycerol kinase
MAIFLLAIDQGTTNTRAMVFDQKAKPISKHQEELTSYFPQPGWVEQDPKEIWQTTLTCIREAISKAKLTFTDIAAIGITNQRETTVLWDRQTGEPIYHAIVWQDRRTAELCQSLATTESEAMIQAKTGLLLDPYFSASKISWLLNNVPGAQAKAQQGKLAFGTMDSYLLWNLTQGTQHATDITNASRTLLFNIHTQQWDDELLNFFHIPHNLLPQVFENKNLFGKTHLQLFGVEIPITAMAGDQQAALIGQACVQAGMLKATYGTGAFLMLNTGEKAVCSKNRLLTTIAYKLDGKTTYGLEGSIFSAGSTIQWLRDKLGVIKQVSDAEKIAARLPNNEGVYFIPAFTGLGAPYWNPTARATITGLTRDSSAGHIVRAALEAVAYQTRDLLEAMINDGDLTLFELRVDGGMVLNNWLMQFISDILHLPIARATVNETTALGAAFLAGLQLGLFDSLEQITALWQCNRKFEPVISQTEANASYGSWAKILAPQLANGMGCR